MLGQQRVSGGHLLGGEIADTHGANLARLHQLCHRLELLAHRRQAAEAEVNLMQVDGKGVQRAKPVVNGAGDASRRASDRTPFGGHGDLAG